MNPSQLSAARATAGARYAAAITELQASLIDLAALERVLSNRAVSAALPASQVPVQTIAEIPQTLPTGLRHGVYAPAYPSNLHQGIDTAAAAYLAAFTPG